MWKLTVQHPLRAVFGINHIWTHVTVNGSQHTCHRMTSNKDHVFFSVIPDIRRISSRQIQWKRHVVVPWDTSDLARVFIEMSSYSTNLMLWLASAIWWQVRLQCFIILRSQFKKSWTTLQKKRPQAVYCHSHLAVYRQTKRKAKSMSRFIWNKHTALPCKRQFC